MINIRLASYVMANNVYIYANFLFLYCERVGRRLLLYKFYNTEIYTF